MKLLAAATLAVLLLTAPAGRAGSLDDANAGLDALGRGDYATAVRLFTKALRAGNLSASDRELAFVRRAQAYIGQQRNDLALADLQQALKLDPNDQEAVNLRLQVQGGGAGNGGGQNGRGTFTFTDGCRYEGEMRNGLPNGRGVKTCPNANRAEGEFRDGNLDGHGVITFANGARIEGEMHGNGPDGQAVGTWSDGSRYEGAWRGGAPNGVGQFRAADGTYYNGIWTNGCFRDGERRASIGTDPANCQ